MLGERGYRCLIYASLPFGDGRLRYYADLANTYSEKAIITKLEDLAAKNYIDYGVSVAHPWLTGKGRQRLDEETEERTRTPCQSIGQHVFVLGKETCLCGEERP